MGRSLRQLIDAARTGNSIPRSDLASVASALARRSSPDPYLAVYLLGIAGDVSMAASVEPYLEYPDEPMVASAALQTLIGRWGMAERHSDSVRRALDGHTWDEDEGLRVTAASVAGTCLRIRWDAPLAASLMAAAGSDNGVLRETVLSAMKEALAGDAWRDLPPAERVRSPASHEAAALETAFRERSSSSGDTRRSADAGRGARPR